MNWRTRCTKYSPTCPLVFTSGMTYRTVLTTGRDENTSCPVALGLFPQVFKSAVIFPLLKKPSLDLNELNNFCPISNLPFISKIIEKLVLVQMSHHLSANNLLNQFQSAYRPRHSTETALLKIVNDLLLSLDDGKISLPASLDLSAAFDTIYHNILLHRLQHDFGLSGTVLDWFSSYLSGRIQSVDLCSLAYICASIGILRCSTRIGFGSYYFRVIHYPSLCCHRASFDPPSFIRRRLPTTELCYSGSPS